MRVLFIFWKYQKALKKLKTFKDYFNFYEKELANENIYVKDSSVTVRSWGSYGFMRFKQITPIYKEDIFPIKRIAFEDFYFYTINKPENYFKDFFGNNYMKIPTNIRLADHIKLYENYLKSKGRNYYISMEDIKNGK